MGKRGRPGLNDHGTGRHGDHKYATQCERSMHVLIATDRR